MTGVFYVPLWQHGGGMDTEYVSAEKVNSGEENSPAAPAGIRTRKLSTTSPALLPWSYPGSPIIVVAYPLTVLDTELCKNCYTSSKATPDEKVPTNSVWEVVSVREEPLKRPTDPS